MPAYRIKRCGESVQKEKGCEKGGMNGGGKKQLVASGGEGELRKKKVRSEVTKGGS